MNTSHRGRLKSNAPGESTVAVLPASSSEELSPVEGGICQMSTVHVRSVSQRGFRFQHLKRALVVARWSLLSVGVASIFISLSLIVRAAESSALCGVDSYVDCKGGVRCTSQDQVGCACYDSSGKVVVRHSCKEAARDELLDDPEV